MSEIMKPNGMKCETCATECNDNCIQCGAPQCCPKCCDEAVAEIRPEPLPCPFCGSKLERHTLYSTWHHRNGIYAMCPLAGATISDVVFWNTRHEDTKATEIMGVVGAINGGVSASDSPATRQPVDRSELSERAPTKRIDEILTQPYVVMKAGRIDYNVRRDFLQLATEVKHLRLDLAEATKREYSKEDASPYEVIITYADHLPAHLILWAQDKIKQIEGGDSKCE